MGYFIFVLVVAAVSMVLAWNKIEQPDVVEFYYNKFFKKEDKE